MSSIEDITIYEVAYMYFKTCCEKYTDTFFKWRDVVMKLKEDDM
jgi:hypothetical protein